MTEWQLVMSAFPVAVMARWLGLVWVGSSSKLSFEVGKRTIDLVAAAVLLFAIAANFLFVAIALRVAGEPRIFETSQWVGRRGKVFTVRRFRTSETAPRKPDGKVRAKKIKEFLRLTSLDQIPLLLSVISGKMSLVGPRARILGEFTVRDLLDSTGEDSRIAILLSVKPGLVSPVLRLEPSATQAEELDIEIAYVRARSLGTDIALLWFVVVRLLFGQIFLPVQRQESLAAHLEEDNILAEISDREGLAEGEYRLLLDAFGRE